MSRLIFLNLPPSITTDKLRHELKAPKKLQDAVLTDLKVVSRRRFAFVGYRTKEEAVRVKEYFDGTFSFGGGKVKVDFVGDEPLAHQKKKTKIPDLPTANDGAPENPLVAEAGPSNKRLQEFMEVMRGTNPGKSTDEVAGAVPGEKGWVADGQKSQQSPKSKRKGKEKDISLSPQASEDEEDDDAAWLKKRQTAKLEDTAIEEKPDADVDLLRSTGRLFVRNLPFTATSEDLNTTFSQYGTVEEVHLPVSRSGDPLGTAFILYRDPQHAVEALRALDKSTFQGRLLHVIPGRAKPGQESQARGLGEDGEVLGKIKQGRADVKGKSEQKKKDAGAKGVNWASLYMNSDAVAASVADRMGISKSELLGSDPSSSENASAAVKLALAETHVIEETKQYFEQAGLDVDSLQPRVPRSQTIILVKNIPYGTTTHTLQDLFGPHGEIERLLLPPSGTLAVVEYRVAADAGRAFKALAYNRLGNAVLYLEKGPVGMFRSKDPELLEKTVSAEEEREALAEKVALVPIAREVPGEADEAGSTLYLKNLSFSTTTPRLQSLLSALPGYSFAKVQTKPNAKTPGEPLSMGYGFVGFKTRDAANKAMSGLADFEVDGKVLEVKFAQRGAEDPSTKDKDKAKANGGMEGKTKGTKVLVKNLPFEISKKEVRELFSAYGSIKALRLPKKPLPTASGAKSSRGFAFLDFTTHAEAERAMEALKHTHLLGRHMVLQWAKEDESVDVEVLREKVGRDWKSEAEAGRSRGKKRKLDLGKGNGDQPDGLEV